MQQATKIEYMLVQLVVRYGETIIYKDVETEDGGKINLSVAQYISYDLGADNLTFHDERYNRILQEAVEQNDNSGFKAESYFTHHPDVSINQLATEMAIDRFQLSKSLQVKHDEETLRNQVEHLVLDFRKEYVQQRLSILKQQIALSANDMERMRQLMEEYKDIQSMRNTIARELGNEVMITR